MVEEPIDGNDLGDTSLVAVEGWARESPPWLLSALLPIVVLIGLGLWLTGFSEDPPVILDATFAEELGEQLLEEELLLDANSEVEIDHQAFSHRAHFRQWKIRSPRPSLP